MDRKSIFIAIACLVLLMVWSNLVNKIYPPKPLPPGDTNAVATAAATVTNQAAATTSTSPPTVTSTNLTAPKALPVFHGEEQTITLVNTNARFTFTSAGGGLKTIELLSFPETVPGWRKHLASTNGVILNTREAAPVLSVLADESVHGDGVFALTETANGVRAEKTLPNGLHIVKEFRLSTNYLFHTTVRLENSSSNALTLPTQEWVTGTSVPMGPDDHGDVQGVMWYDGKSSPEQKERPWFDGGGILFWKSPPRTEFRAGQSNVVWVAAQNQFFTLVAMPATHAVSVVSRPIELPRPAHGWASDTNNPVPKGFQTALVYPAVTLAPGQSLERQIHFFAGPKEYRTLARVADRFQNSSDLVMGYGGFLGFFSKALLLGMNWVHHALHVPYGWAIIVITVVIKVLFWPLTAASTRSAKRMQALAPQIAALKEKYKDDPQKFSAKQWEFWKKNKVNPMSGCLPMLVQLPVFFGLYGMIRTAIELRGASFLWALDLSQPDTLYIIPGLNFIPFLGTPEGLPLNLLPIIYIATALWQSHLTPASPGMDPAQQKMMRWMPLMFLVILYNFSSGLALYMTVNNLLTILQTKLTKTLAPATPAGPATVPALTPASKKKK